MERSVFLIRSADVAAQLPFFVPPDEHPRRRQSEVTKCVEHAGPLAPVLITTLAPGGDPELAEEYPLAIDGWWCSEGEHLEFPALLSEDEVNAINTEAIAAARAGRLQEAELGFLRLANSLPWWAQAHVNLGSVYVDKLEVEQCGRSRPGVSGRYAEVARQHLEFSLVCEPPAPNIVRLMLGRLCVRSGEIERGETLLRAFLDEVDVPEPQREEALALLEEVAGNADYIAGIELVRPYMRLADAQGADPTTPDAEEDLQRGIALLTAVAEKYDNASAWWHIGMAERSRGRHSEEYEALAKAHRLDPEQPDMARELMAACLSVGQTAAAVEAARAAVAADPDDPGLEANLGLALLYDGQTDAALEAARSALSRASDDRITASLVAFIEDVCAGRKEPPTRFPPSG